MAVHKTKNGIVGRFGKWWTRASENISRLKNQDLKKATGIYVLYNGTMPVYIGKGNFSQNISRHNRSSKRSPFWEHFSWYEIKGKGLDKEVESLFLRILPFYAHSLNRMRGGFLSGERIDPASDKPVKDLWPKGGAAKKRLPSKR
jgi:hypothetical protein